MKVKELREFLDKCVKEYGNNDDYDIKISGPGIDLDGNCFLNPIGKKIIFYINEDQISRKVLINEMV